MRLGVMRVLMLGAVLSASSNLLFAWLGTRGHDVQSLVFVISADNLSSGIASAGFIAYLSGLTNVSYSATQYALFSSIMLLLPKWLAGFSGRSSRRSATATSSSPRPASACRCCCWCGWPVARSRCARRPSPPALAPRPARPRLPIFTAATRPLSAAARSWNAAGRGPA
jgi:hypothetical protein